MAQVVPHDDVVGSNADDGVDTVEVGEGGIGGEEFDGYDYQYNIARKHWLIRDVEGVWEMLTYAYLKELMEWFLITATISFSFTVSVLCENFSCLFCCDNRMLDMLLYSICSSKT